MKFMISMLCLCLLFSASAFAADYPVDKGSTFLSGGASYTNQSGDLYENWEGEGTSQFSIVPSLVHFVTPNFAVGGDMEFTYVSQGDCSATGLGIGPKLAYFVGEADAKVYPFFALGFNYIRYTSGCNGSDRTVDGTRFKFGGGVAVLLNTHLSMGFEGVVAMDTLKPERGDSESGTTFGINIGLGGFIF
jgi:hypothetical protein